MIKSFLESFRSYSLLAEEELLVEGRIDDAKNKYPELAKQRKELDGESLLDVLMGADPSDNQKYLMGAAKILQNSMEAAESDPDDPRSDRRALVPFWGKEWPEDPDDNLYSPWGIAKNIAGELSKFHKLQPFIQTARRDINTIKDWNSLYNVVALATIKQQNKEKEKEEKKRASKQAKEESEIILDTPYHLVVRPLSAHASCYFGKSTRWCISATEAQNYFDQYTSDGKAFCFLLAKNKTVDPPYAKIAMVFNRDGGVDEIFDAEDDSMTTSFFRDAIRQCIVGSAISGEMTSLEEKEPYNKDAILIGLEKFKDIDGFDFDSMEQTHDDVKMVVALFDDTVVAAYINELEEAGGTSVSDTPPGVPDEAYENKLAEYSFNFIDVQLLFPDETGTDRVFWEANTYIDIEKYVLDAEQFDFVPNVDAISDTEIYDAVDNALNGVNIYPEHLEQNDWDNRMEFTVKIDTGGGDLDSFDSWLDNVDYDDKKMTEDFRGHLMDQLEEAGIIIDPARLEREKEAARQKTRDAEYWPDPEEKKKQLEFPLQENKFRIKILKKH